MAFVKGLRIAAYVSILLFLSLFCLSLLKSRQGPWHQQVTDLWNRQQWYQLRSLAENLYQSGQPDTECLFVAMLASQQAQHASGVQLFAERVLAQKPVNWKIETTTAAVYNAAAPRQRIALYRTRFLFLLLFFLSGMLLWSIYQKHVPALWLISLSVLGCTALFL